MNDSRPPCNIVEGCNNPGVIMIGTKICCETHILLYIKKLNEYNDKIISEMMNDAQ